MSDQKQFLEEYINDVVKVLQEEVNFSTHEMNVEELKSELRSSNFSEFWFPGSFGSFKLFPRRTDGKPGLFLFDQTGSKGMASKVDAANERLLVLHEKMVRKILGK